MNTVLLPFSLLKAKARVKRVKRKTNHNRFCCVSPQEIDTNVCGYRFPLLKKHFNNYHNWKRPLFAFDAKTKRDSPRVFKFLVALRFALLFNHKVHWLLFGILQQKQTAICYTFALSLPHAFQHRCAWCVAVEIKTHAFLWPTESKLIIYYQFIRSRRAL